MFFVSFKKCEKELEWLSLVAYAPYNTAWDLDLYKQWWEYSIISNYVSAWYTNQLGTNSIRNSSNLNSYWNVLSKSSSFLESDWNKGILLTTDWAGTTYADVLKYSNLNLDSDFIIEMNVKIPDDSDKHYLLSYGNSSLYILNWYLYFNAWYGWISYSSNLNKWEFNTIFLKRDDLNKIYFKLWTWSWLYWSNNNSSNIDELIIWAYYRSASSDYRYQINDIIDYIKIYK